MEPVTINRDAMYDDKNKKPLEVQQADENEMVSGFFAFLGIGNKKAKKKDNDFTDNQEDTRKKKKKK